jgi:hypothetical protein
LGDDVVVGGEAHVRDEAGTGRAPQQMGAAPGAPGDPPLPGSSARLSGTAGARRR